jgi:hypothetical protein
MTHLTRETLLLISIVMFLVWETTLPTRRMRFLVRVADLLVGIVAASTAGTVLPCRPASSQAIASAGLARETVSSCFSPADSVLDSVSRAGSVASCS